MSLVARLFVVILVAWLVPVLVVLAMMEPPVSLTDGWVMLPILGGLALSLWVGQRWFARPLAGLSGTAGRWRSGNVAARSDVSGDSGEIGHLARTFDEIAGSTATVTRQLETARADLRRADAKAQQIAQSTARILSAASHDLRQPLQAMNLSVSLLSSRHRADSDTAALARITRSIQQLGHQIDLIVQTTRLQAGLVVPRVDDVALQPLIDAVTHEFAEVFGQKSITFTHAVCDETVRSDAQLLTLMLRSLLANAVRFTPAGGSVAVECETHGEHLRVSVRDTGVGMTPDRRAELKVGLSGDPDVAADGGAESSDGLMNGLGTGLTLVRQGLRLLGHALSFDSTLGEGSVFQIDMPRVVVGESAPKSTPTRTAAIGVAIPPQPTMSLRGRVLLVEDDAQSEDGTAEALRETGLKVVSALELEDALDTLESEASSTDTASRSAKFDALVVRRAPSEARDVELCRSLAERFPSTRLFVVADATAVDGSAVLQAAGVTMSFAPLSAAMLATAIPALVSRQT
ncbi:MAG: two-component hybrid sensor and regulator [Rhizobacter sp.]|nr:two-component hybrid sensor and regulator [Rhizobacter sp.]